MSQQTCSSTELRSHSENWDADCERRIARPSYKNRLHSPAAAPYPGSLDSFRRECPPATQVLGRPHTCPIPLRQRQSPVRGQTSAAPCGSTRDTAEKTSNDSRPFARSFWRFPPALLLARKYPI